MNHLMMFLALFVVTGNVVAQSDGGTHATEPTAAGARKVVARVNGRPIYEEQLKPDVERRLKTFKRFGMRKDSTDLVKRLQRQALSHLIGVELIQQESRKIAIADIDKRVQQRLKALETKYGSGEKFDKYLKMRRLTMDRLKESLRAKVYVDEYLKKQGILEPAIAEERIREVYDKDPKSYSREETVNVSHILIGVDGAAGVDEKKQARQKAEKIRGEIIAGKDFGEMAKKHSDCNSASGGGDLRFIKRGYMPKEFDKAAFALEKNTVSEVVETKFGYHIIKVVDKQAGGIVPYGEVKDFIKKFLQEGESKKKLETHISDLKRAAKIEILLGSS